MQKSYKKNPKYYYLMVPLSFTEEGGADVMLEEQSVEH